MSTKTVVALTGSTGFIGSTILKNLIECGYRVRILVRNPHKINQSLSEDIEIIPGDLSCDSALSAFVDGVETIIHCAGRVRGREYSEFKIDNIDGTRNLLNSATKSSHLNQFIHISSLAAREPELSHYAQSKHTGELLLTENSFDKWVIIRPPAVYGPSDTEMKPLFDWTRRGILWVLGNPRQRFSLLHAEDLGRLILTLVDSKMTQQQILEPDDGYTGGYSWQSIQKITAEYFNKNVNLVSLPSSMLTSTAHMNMVFSKLLNYSPMLTPGKVRELVHDNWLSNLSTPVPQWSPTIDLKTGLSTLYSQ